MNDLEEYEFNSDEPASLLDVLKLTVVMTGFILAIFYGAQIVGNLL